jgi:DNA-binding SARP family transcriptional activator
MNFMVLGPLQVCAEGRSATPTAPKVRQVLALLVARSNQVVGMDSLIEELWEEQPPHSAMNTARTYIHHLRTFLVKQFGKELAEQLIVTVGSGYLLNLSRATVDTTDFDSLIIFAHQSLAANQIQQAAEYVTEALRMWSGRPLSNVCLGPLLRCYVTHLEDKRIAALELRVRIDLLLGRHRELIAELRPLVAEHPFNEWFHAQLMLALHKSGRRNDALHAYHNVRTLLNDELGLDPSTEIQRVHHDILTSSERPIELAVG